MSNIRIQSLAAAIFLARGVRRLNQCCGQAPLKNLFQQPARSNWQKLDTERRGIPPLSTRACRRDRAGGRRHPPGAARALPQDLRANSTM